MLHRIISGQVYQHPYDRLMDEPTYTRSLAIVTNAYFGNGGDRYDSLIFVNILAIDIAFGVLEALTVTMVLSSETLMSELSV